MSTDETGGTLRMDAMVRRAAEVVVEHQEASNRRLRSELHVHMAGAQALRAALRKAGVLDDNDRVVIRDEAALAEHLAALAAEANQAAGAVRA